MRARTSEFTFDEVQRLWGRRFRVLREVQGIPAESVLRIRSYHPYLNGFAVVVVIEYTPKYVDFHVRSLSLKEVHENLQEIAERS